MIRQQRSPQGLVSFCSFVLQIARLVWGYYFFFLFLKKEKKKKEKRKQYDVSVGGSCAAVLCVGFFVVVVVVVFVTLGMLQIYLLISVNKQFQTFRLAHFCVFI